MLFVSQLVDALHQEEHAERDDDEVDEVLDETAIIDGGGLHFYAVGNLLSRKRYLQVGELPGLLPPDSDELS